MTSHQEMEAHKKIASDLAKIEMEHHKMIMDRLDKIDESQKVLKAKIDPMYEIFSSVTGFNQTAVWILKLLAMVGGALVGFYALIEFIKKSAR